MSLHFAQGVWHTFFNSEVFRVLAVLAQQRGLLSSCEATGLFGAADDWRIPDQLYCRPDDVTDSGVTSAELVVEIRSPGDESYDKLDFYAARGVAEVLIVHEDRRAELYRRRADGTMTQVEQDGPFCAATPGLHLHHCSRPETSGHVGRRNGRRLTSCVAMERLSGA